MSHSANLPVTPHVGDMAQVHQHLCFAHTACDLLEYIPWLHDWMEHPARIQERILRCSRRARRRNDA